MMSIDTQETDLENVDKVRGNITANAFPMKLKSDTDNWTLEIFTHYLNHYYKDNEQSYFDGCPWVPIGELCGIIVIGNIQNVPQTVFPQCLVIRVIIDAPSYLNALQVAQEFVESSEGQLDGQNEAWMPIDHDFADDPREAVKMLIQFSCCSDQQREILREYVNNYDPSSKDRPVIDEPLLDSALDHCLGHIVYPMHLAQARTAAEDVIDASARKRFNACSVYEGDDYVVMVVNSSKEDPQLKNFYRSKSKTRTKSLIQVPSKSRIVLSFSDIDVSKSSSSSKGNVDISSLQQSNNTSARSATRSKKKPSGQKILYIDPNEFNRRKREFSTPDNVAAMIMRGQRDSSQSAKLEDPPAQMALLWIIHVAISSNSSDIHIEQYDTESYESQVRLRIDGTLRLLMRLGTEAQSRLNGVLKNYASISSDKAITGAGRINISHKEHGLWYGRLEAIPCNNGNSDHEQNIVVRLSRRDASGAALSLNQIGFETIDLAVFRKSIMRPYGINIICGPTGSGKTTTLYAALEEVNQPGRKIVTAENPIERTIPGINQVDTGVRDELSFDTILKSFLRFDPDIILVGETRDKQEAKLAIEAALTGHLIFTTLHTNSAAGAIPRLLEMGIPGDLLAESINMIQAQRLIRRLCNECKQAYTPDEQELKKLRSARINIGPQDKLYRAQERGCKECSGIGYSGRCMIVEIVPFVDEVKAAVMDSKHLGISKTTEAITEASRRYGMRSLYENGLVKVASGVTSMAEVSKWNSNWLNLDIL